jgi:hypothetical protein
MFHLVSVWLTRVVVAGVLIALVLMYGPKWFADQATSTGTPTAPSTEKAAPIAPAQKSAPVEKASPAATEQPAAQQPAVQQPAIQQPADGSASFARCQPIGRTARGELVYSMDCRRE